MIYDLKLCIYRFLKGLSYSCRRVIVAWVSIRQITKRLLRRFASSQRRYLTFFSENNIKSSAIFVIMLFCIFIPAEAKLSESLFLVDEPMLNSPLQLNSGSVIEPDNDSYLDKLKEFASNISGLHLNTGFTIAVWSFNTGDMFEIVSSSARMVFLEAYYSNVLLDLSEALQLFRRPYFKIQTDLGSRGSADLISVSGQSSINHQGNLKLIALTNIIDPLFFRYDKEVYAAGITSYGGFDFYPFEGTFLQVQPQQELLLITEFQSFEVGVKGYVGEDGFGEFTIYHDTWQKPWSADSVVYASRFDFWGIGLGFYGDTDFYQDGKFVSSNSMGYYFKMGNGRIDLTSNKTANPYVGAGYDSTPFYHWKFEVEYRHYVPIRKNLSLGVILDYYFQKIEQLKREGDTGSGTEIISRDQRFLLSVILQLLK